MPQPLESTRTAGRALLLVNVVLYLGLASIVVAYRAELRWAVLSLPTYIVGTVAAPPERQLYWDALSANGDAEWQTKAARDLLERSLAIDPNNDAACLLADSYFDRDELEQAAAQYERCLKFDPTQAEAYLKLSAIHERRQNYDSALRVLRDGAEFFEREVVLQRPVLDDGVEARFNRKAVRAYDHYRLAERLLEHEIVRISAKAERR